ncbi:MAG: hypothetical protein IPJ79_18750 [Bacteroidetes bacterium]|nr:hypothetical protein [Bacteroidota bacterium]
MRNPNLKCLLCETNNSTKENSHIIPKFMGKEIFKTEKGNRGFVIGTNSAHLPPQITQDSPKESYILCPSCEQYISILETYIATRFHSRLWDKKFSQQFGTFNNNGGITWKVCNEIEPAVFRLFIYSIVWRCSISSVPLCKDFLLNKEEEERLRLSLLLCKYETQIELLSNISKHANEITLPEFLLLPQNLLEIKQVILYSLIHQ